MVAVDPYWNHHVYDRRDPLDTESPEGVRDPERQRDLLKRSRPTYGRPGYLMDGALRRNGHCGAQWSGLLNLKHTP